MTNKGRKINFIYCYLPVRDLEKSKQWYVSNFHFEEFGETELRIDPMVLLTMVETHETNHYYISAKGSVRPILGFCVNEIDELHSRLKNQGVVVENYCQNTWGTTFEFIDMDGNRIEVWSGYRDDKH